MSKLDEDFIYQVLSIVGEIPEGKVSTYGEIAKLLGKENNSRLVGRVLSSSDSFGDYPCHRVVNANGRLVPSWFKQKELLLREEIIFKDNGHVDLRKCLWRGE